MVKVQHRWVRHIKDPEQKNKFKERLNGDEVLQVLTILLEEDLKEACKTRQVDYDKASWAHYQAHQNGVREALENVLKLINIKE